MFIKQLFKFFSRKEIFIFSGALFVFLLSFSLLAANYIKENTKIVAVSGGEHREGVLGQPSFINPVLTVSSADKDLVELLFGDFSGMIDTYKISEDGKSWRYRLKDGIFWQDSRPITSDDVIFTVETIQNSDVRSPLFSNWQGVKISRVSEREVEFNLPASYSFFNDTVLGLKPIPKHIFADIPAANLRLSNYNFEPVGSGPFRFKNLSKRSDGYITSYVLEQSKNYFGPAPYLGEIEFVFFTNEEEMVNAFNLGAIDAFGLTNPDDWSKIAFTHKISFFKTLKYYAVFFNINAQPALKDKNVRLALNTAVDKNEIIDKVLKRQATPVSGPLIGGPSGLGSESSSFDKANAILENTGWKWNNKENVRTKEIEKNTVKLEFNLTVPEMPFLIKTAELIRDQWLKIGVKLNISVLSLAEINNNIIKNRNYQMILFGNILGKSPDLFSFWHSSERFYPGLNLALYENKIADSLIESIRKDFDETKRQSEFMSLQSLIEQDHPAVFLYSPDYLYVSKKTLSGVEESSISSPEERFKNIAQWYIKTARVFK